MSDTANHEVDLRGLRNQDRWGAMNAGLSQDPPEGVSFNLEQERTPWGTVARPPLQRDDE